MGNTAPKPPPKLPPGLETFAGRVFNMRDLDFGPLIFNFAYSQGHTMEYGPSHNQQTYDVPDSIDAYSVSLHQSSDSQMFAATESDYDYGINASMEGELTYGSYSGSVSSGLVLHKNIFQSSGKSYSLTSSQWTVYHFTRKGLGKVDPQFLTAVNKLLSSKKPDYRSFFDTWGTHYIEEGYVGGSLFQVVEIDDILLETNSSTDIQTSVKAGFDKVVASGEISIDAAINESTFLDSNEKNTSVNFVQIGGDAFKDGEQLDDWTESIYYSPELLMDIQPGVGKSPRFSLISNLPGIQSGGKATLEYEIEVYLEEGQVEDGIFRSPQTPDPARAYAPHEHPSGIVVGHAPYGGRPQYSVTAEATAITSSWRNTLISGTCKTSSGYVINTVSLPVSSDETFTVDTKTPHKTPTPTLFTFYPFISDVELVKRSKVVDNQIQQATSDMFVMANLGVSDKEYNYLLGYADASKSVVQNETKATIRGACSCNYVWTHSPNARNSFCMPVRKGEYYTIKSTTKQGSIEASSIVFQLSGFKFGDVQLMDNMLLNKIQQAPTDLILFYWLWCNENFIDSSAPWIGVRSSFDQQLMPAIQPATSRTNAYNPYSSAMIPILKGNYYKVVFEKEDAKDYEVHVKLIEIVES